MLPDARLGPLVLEVLAMASLLVLSRRGDGATRRLAVLAASAASARCAWGLLEGRRRAAIPRPAPRPRHHSTETKMRSARTGGADDARRDIAPRAYTDAQHARGKALGPISVQPVGWVESPYKERFGTPRQPVVTAVVSGGDEQLGAIVLAQGLGLENSLRDLAGFDYCWVVAHMHLNTGWRPLIQPPRGPKRRRGVFATRAPHRPSQIALSALRIVSVDEKNLRINVKGLDLLDGTPIFDIKPYIPYCDAFPDANAGWVDDLDGAPDGPDGLAYSPPPNFLLPAAKAAADEAAAAEVAAESSASDDPR